jgi:hypothetical protein
MVMVKKRRFFKKKLFFGILLIAIGIAGVFISFHGGFEGGILTSHVFNNIGAVGTSGYSTTSGEGAITGYSILDNPTNKFVAYVIFVVIIFIGVGLIVWSNWHDREKEESLKGRKKRK